jgi:hypothetical protein
VARHDGGAAGDDGQEELLGPGDVEAGVRVLVEQPLDDRPQRARVRSRVEVVGDDGGQAGEHAVPLERRPALDCVVQRGSQRPQIRGRPGDAAAGPLGRDVGRRADQHAGRGQGRAVGGLGDTKVGQDDPALGTQQDVGRLHVPVHHPGLVHRAQGAQHAEADLGRLGRGNRPVLGHRVAQRAERDELHDDAGAVVFLDDVVDGHHVRVMEARRQLRFADGAAAGDLTLGRVELRRPDDLLDGHVPVEQFVARLPDRAHSAPADDGAEPVSVSENSL